MYFKPNNNKQPSLTPPPEWEVGRGFKKKH